MEVTFLLWLSTGNEQLRVKNNENQGMAQGLPVADKPQAVDKHWPRIQQEWLNLKDIEHSAQGRPDSLASEVILGKAASLR